MDHQSMIVAVRVRPFSPKELEDNHPVSIIKVPKAGVIHLLSMGTHVDRPTRQFMFDHTFWSVDKQTSSVGGCTGNSLSDKLTFADQSVVYKKLGYPLLMRSLEGYNATMFAYGQTSSGKTYTVMGPSDNPGIIPRLVDDLFTEINRRQSTEVEYLVELSYFEIYNEKIRDLLSHDQSNKVGLTVREHPVTGPYVEFLSRIGVRSHWDILGWLRTGDKQRTVSATQFNEQSSRSHAVFTLYLTRRTVAKCPFGNITDSVCTSQLNIVDLAGSERVASSRDDSRSAETRHINKSLFTLGKVILELSRRGPSTVCPATEPRRPKKQYETVTSRILESKTPNRFPITGSTGFISYRSSVLTWLLKDSLGGNSITTMLATVSPSLMHHDETLATLRYVKKAQSITNVAVINEDPQGRVIRQLMTEIEQLRASSAITAVPGSPQAFEIARLRDLLTVREREIKQLSKQLDKRLFSTCPEQTQHSSPDKESADKCVQTSFAHTSITHSSVHVDQSSCGIAVNAFEFPDSQLTTPLRANRIPSLSLAASTPFTIPVEPLPTKDVALGTSAVWGCSLEEKQVLNEMIDRLQTELQFQKTTSHQIQNLLSVAENKLKLYEKQLTVYRRSNLDDLVDLHKLLAHLPREFGL